MEGATTTDGQTNPSNRDLLPALNVESSSSPESAGQDAEDQLPLIRRLEEYLNQIQFERSRWEATVESMLDPVTVGDAEGHAIYMNQAYKRMVGYGIDQNVPLDLHASHYKLYRPDGTLYRSEELPLQRAALKDEEVSGAEIVQITSTGESVITVWNASPIHSSDGKVVGAVAVGRDVTERRRAEEAQARLAAIVESSEDAILGKTLDGIVTSWNRGAERLYGYSAPEMIGRSILTVVPEEARAELAEIMAHLKNGGRTERIETVRLRKDGSRVLVSLTISPLRDSSCNIIGASAIARDVTAQRQAQDAQNFLTEVSAVLSASLDYGQVLDSVARLAVPTLADICIVDIIEEDTVRQRVSSLDGRDYDECLDLIQASYSLEGAEASHPVWEVLRTGRPVTLASGTDDEMPEALVEAGVQACVVVPLTIRGRPVGAISCISVDAGRAYGPSEVALAAAFAHRAAIAIDNARLYRDAKNAVRARDQFLSIAAHELKTPMTSLRGFVQLTMRQLDRDGVVDPAQARQAFKVIDQQSRRLSALISQLLDVSRLEAGRLSLERRVADISSLVEAAVAFAVQTSTEHAIDATIQPTVLALVDPLRIEQVVSALIENAAKFSPVGTRIDIELSQPSRETVRLVVRDRGPGVPVEQRSRIFTRFYHGQPNEQAGGMGLGLYVSREIVVLHGGTIVAEFPEDGGSRFVVTLPTGLADRE